MLVRIPEPLRRRLEAIERLEGIGPQDRRYAVIELLVEQEEARRAAAGTHSPLPSAGALPAQEQP